MKTVRIALLLALMLLFTVCVTNVSELGVSEMNLKIIDREGRETELLLPGHSYTMDATVLDAGGTLYDNPDYTDFSLLNLRGVKILRHTHHSLSFGTSIETFHSQGSAPYRFTLSIEDNPSPARVYRFYLDWDNFDRIDYSGTDGDRWKEHTPRVFSPSEAVDDHREFEGDNGNPGEDVRMLVTRYRYGEDVKLLFYEMEKQHLFLSDIQPMTIDSSGGDGGRGGSIRYDGTGVALSQSMGDASLKINYAFYSGGRGGDGGNGGSIRLLYTHKDTADLVELNSAGGEGGPGGRGHRDGKPGEDGQPGATTRRRISIPRAEQILSRIDRPGYSLDSVIF